MKVSDEKFWMKIRTVYSMEDETQIILDFTENWATTTEKILDVNSDLPPQERVTFRQALDSSFFRSIFIQQPTDDVPGLKVGSDIVAEALFLLTQVWGWSEELIGCLSCIEQNMLETIFHEKILSLNVKATEGNINA